MEAIQAEAIQVEAMQAEATDAAEAVSRLKWAQNGLICGLVALIAPTPDKLETATKPETETKTDKGPRKITGRFKSTATDCRTRRASRLFRLSDAVPPYVVGTGQRMHQRCRWFGEPVGKKLNRHLHQFLAFNTPEAISKEADMSSLPLVVTGPGGDFVTGYIPDESTGEIKSFLGRPVQGAVKSEIGLDSKAISVKATANRVEAKSDEESDLVQDLVQDMWWGEIIENYGGWSDGLKAEAGLSSDSAESKQSDSSQAATKPSVTLVATPAKQSHLFIQETTTSVQSEQNEITEFNNESHPKAAKNSHAHTRYSTDTRLLADDAGTRRRAGNQQGHGLRARAGTHQKRRSRARTYQGSLFEGESEFSAA